MYNTSGSSTLDAFETTSHSPSDGPTSANLTQHNAHVSQISRQISQFHSEGVKWHIYHGSTNSTRPQHDFTHSNTIDISPLNDIVSITRTSSHGAADHSHVTHTSIPPSSTQAPSTKTPPFRTFQRPQNPSQFPWAGTALVQPNTPMDRLVQISQEHDLLPPVVPEFPGITVGGALAGTGGESSSWKYGFFDECVLGVQVVLADGTVLWAKPRTRSHHTGVDASERGRQVNGEVDSEHAKGGVWEDRDEDEDNSDLFEAVKGTFGTLGVVTLVEIGLISVPKGSMVMVEYRFVSGLEEVLDQMERLGVGSKEVGEDGKAENRRIVTGQDTEPSTKGENGTQPLTNGVFEKELISNKDVPGVDFIDAILFTPTHGCLITGHIIPPSHPLHPDYPRPPSNLNHRPHHPLPIKTFSNPTDQWFYLHCHTASIWSRTISPSSDTDADPDFSQQSNPQSSKLAPGNTRDSSGSYPHTELVPLTDYLFRYDRGAFWMGRYAFEYFGVPFGGTIDPEGMLGTVEGMVGRTMRYALDWSMHSRIMYHALHRAKGGMVGRFFVQDLAVPVGIGEISSEEIGNRDGDGFGDEEVATSVRNHDSNPEAKVTGGVKATYKTSLRGNKNGEGGEYDGDSERRTSPKEGRRAPQQGCQRGSDEKGREAALRFYAYIQQNLDIWPLWLCPIKPPKPSQKFPRGSRGSGVSMNPNRINERLAHALPGCQGYLLNFGIWGLPRLPYPKDGITGGSEDGITGGSKGSSNYGLTATPPNMVALNRAVEGELKAVGGMKWLYAKTYYTESEFWEIYDGEWYGRVRRKYKAMGLPSVWDKVRTKEQRQEGAMGRAGLEWVWDVWPLGGLYGVLSAWKGGDYLRRGKGMGREGWLGWLGWLGW